MTQPLTIDRIREWAAGIAASQGTATPEEEALAHRIRAAAPLDPWIDSASWNPSTGRCVLATDLETHFIACFDAGAWVNAWTEEPIDSQITHWMELPEPPEA